MIYKIGDDQNMLVSDGAMLRLGSDPMLLWLKAHLRTYVYVNFLATPGKPEDEQIRSVGSLKSHVWIWDSTKFREGE